MTTISALASAAATAGRTRARQCSVFTLPTPRPLERRLTADVWAPCLATVFVRSHLPREAPNPDVPSDLRRLEASLSRLCSQSHNRSRSTKQHTQALERWAGMREPMWTFEQFAIIQQREVTFGNRRGLRLHS